MQVFELALILHVFFIVFSEKLLISDKVVCTYVLLFPPSPACSTIQLPTVQLIDA